MSSPSASRSRSRSRSPCMQTPINTHQPLSLRKRKRRRRKSDHVHVSRSPSPEFSRNTNASHFPSPKRARRTKRKNPQGVISKSPPVSSSTSPELNRRSSVHHSGSAVRSSRSTVEQSSLSKSTPSSVLQGGVEIVHISRSSSPDFSPKANVSRSRSPKLSKSEAPAVSSNRCNSDSSRSPMPSDLGSKSKSQKRTNSSYNTSSHSRSRSVSPTLSPSPSRGSGASIFRFSQNESLSREAGRSFSRSRTRSPQKPSSRETCGVTAQRNAAQSISSKSFPRSHRRFSRSRSRSPSTGRIRNPILVSSQEPGSSSQAKKFPRKETNSTGKPGASDPKRRKRKRSRSPSVSEMRSLAHNVSNDANEKLCEKRRRTDENVPSLRASRKNVTDEGHLSQLQTSPSPSKESSTTPTSSVHTNVAASKQTSEAVVNLAINPEKDTAPHDVSLPPDLSLKLLRHPSVKTFPRMHDTSGSFLESSSMPILQRPPKSVAPPGTFRSSSANDHYNVQSNSSPARRLPTPVKSNEKRTRGNENRGGDGEVELAQRGSFIDHTMSRQARHENESTKACNVSRSQASTDYNSNKRTSGFEEKRNVSREDQHKSNISRQQSVVGSPVDSSESSSATPPPKLLRFIASRVAVCGSESELHNDREVRMILKICHNLRRFRREKRQKYRRLSFSVLKRRKMSLDGFRVLKFIGFMKSRVRICG